MHPLKILVVEDLVEDVLILKRAFLNAAANVQLHFVHDGQEAIDYLKGEQAFADRTAYPLPSLLLLDLKMPRLGGFDVLEWVRVQTNLRRLVVIMFTSSELPEDINRAYELGANSYLVKPSSFNHLLEIARSLESYWLKHNRCPECLPVPSRSNPQARVLLRNVKTGHYFQGPERWTDNCKDALNFERTERAIQSALGMKLQPVEIIIQVEEHRFNVRVPFTADHIG